MAICIILTLFLTGCINKESTVENPENNTNVQVDIKSNENNLEETNTDAEKAISEENQKGDQGKETLNQFTNEEIEYARIWLQLGPNQQLDELYIKHIPAGTPLNPDDTTSASYPEDVIQLAGSRLVDGSVTYSGNGNGTINVYNVPLRWDGINPAGEQMYIDIIQNTKLEYVDPGDVNEVIELIKLQRHEES